MKIYKDNMLFFLDELIKKVKEENKHQINKFGIQERSAFEWLTYLTEEIGELAQAITEYEYKRTPDKISILEEAIQTATLSLKIAEIYYNEIVKNL